MRLDWDQLTVQLISCGYSKWPNGVVRSFTWENRVIPDNDLWIFDTGRGVMDMRSGRIKLNETSILWMRPGHFYEVEQELENPVGHVYIHFELIRPDGSKFYPSTAEMPETFECFNHAHWLAMGRNLVRVMNMGRTAIPTGGLTFSECTSPEIVKVVSHMLKSMLMGIDLCDSFSRSDNSSGAGNLVAIQAAEFLAEADDSFLSIQKAAKHFSLSRNRFSKLFSDFWHISPQDFLIEQRIQRARRLLEDTDWTLGEIAGSLGYSDHYFFARQFKEKTGDPPGAYRRQKRIKLK